LNAGPRSAKPQIQNLKSTDWPTYRHDPARTGATQAAVPPELSVLREARLGGQLSSPVVAEGLALVASARDHSIHAVDAATGQERWQFTAEGGVDSPPTIAAGLVVFGCADGWVYCLRAAEGALVWRSLVAPQERRVVAFGRVESAWPVSGSVLIRDGVAYCAAGRSSSLDGGIHLCKLDLQTGRELARRVVYSRDAETGEQPEEPLMFELPGALPDVLSTDGDSVYMRRLSFAADSLQPQEPKAHLYSPAGFLHDDWWRRTYWIFGDHFYSGYIGLVLRRPGGASGSIALDVRVGALRLRLQARVLPRRHRTQVPPVLPGPLSGDSPAAPRLRPCQP